MTFREAMPTGTKPNPAGFGSMGISFLRGTVKPRYAEGPNPVKIADLFAGCGGMSLGVAEAARMMGRGMKVTLAIEASHRIWAVYVRNFAPSTPASECDITNVFDGAVGSKLTGTEEAVARSAGSIDLLVGGPPCQGHSHLNNHTRGSDPKNGLYLRMVRAAEVLRPRHVIIENVPAIQNDSGRVLETALDGLGKLGFRTASGVVKVADLGVPQSRKRHVVVASMTVRPDIGAAVERCRQATLTVRDAISDLRGIEAAEPFDEAASLSKANQRRAKWLLRNEEYDLPNHLRPACHRETPTHSYKSMYGRLHWDLPAQTITTGFGSPGQGRYLHPIEPRTLTPHEAARLQYFPDWFDFSSVDQRTILAEMIGNAVPPRLAFALSLELLVSERAVSGRSLHGLEGDLRRRSS